MTGSPDLTATEILAAFPITDGGVVKVARENVGLDSPVWSFRAVRYHADGYAIQHGEWHDRGADAMTDGLNLAGWLTGVLNLHAARHRDAAQPLSGLAVDLYEKHQAVDRDHQLPEIKSGKRRGTVRYDDRYYHGYRDALEDTRMIVQDLATKAAAT